MAVPPPPSTYGLWPAVEPRIGGWIQTDEDALLALAEQWTKGADAFDAVLDGGGPVGSLPSAAGGSWADPAGHLWQRQILRIGSDLRTREAELRALAAYVAAFAEDVGHAKREINRVIVENLPAYAKLVLLPGGGDAGAHETFVGEIARAINAFLDGLAGRIAARTPAVVEGSAGTAVARLEGADAARPSASVDQDDLDGFGLKELADVMGTVSAIAGAGALLFPPAAAVLGPLALVTGAGALYGHGVELARDPSPAKAVTVAADALGVVPGVGTLARGGALALEQSARSVNPLWREVASGLHAGPATDDVARGLQVASRLVPQAPTAADLVLPGEHSDIGEAANAQKVIWRSLEQVARLR